MYGLYMCLQVLQVNIQNTIIPKMEFFFINRLSIHIARTIVLKTCYRIFLNSLYILIRQTRIVKLVHIYKSNILE